TVLVVMMLGIMHKVLLLRWLQPVLVDVGFQLVAGRPQIATPQITLFEAHLVEDVRRQSGLVVGKALRVAKPAMNRGNNAHLTPEVPGRAAVTEHRPGGHAHTITGGEPRGGRGLGGAPLHSPHHGTFSFAALRPAFSCLAHTSATRASISS